MWKYGFFCMVLGVTDQSILPKKTSKVGCYLILFVFYCFIVLWVCSFTDLNISLMRSGYIIHGFVFCIRPHVRPNERRRTNHKSNCFFSKNLPWVSFCTFRPYRCVFIVYIYCVTGAWSVRLCIAFNTIFTVTTSFSNLCVTTIITYLLTTRWNHCRLPAVPSQCVVHVTYCL